LRKKLFKIDGQLRKSLLAIRFSFVVILFFEVNEHEDFARNNVFALVLRTNGFIWLAKNSIFYFLHIPSSNHIGCETARASV